MSHSALIADDTGADRHDRRDFDGSTIQQLRRSERINTSRVVVDHGSVIESITQRITPIASDAKVAASTILQLGAELREAQEVFAATGGLHACGLFDVEGKLLAARGEADPLMTAIETQLRSMLGIPAAGESS